MLGRQIWHPGMGLNELADRIRFGYAPAGWEGDPRLVLSRRDGIFELLRRERDDSYSVVATLAPGKDPYGIIDELVRRDFRRGGMDLIDAVDRANAKREADIEYRADQRICESAEALAWAVKKDDVH